MKPAELLHARLVSQYLIGKRAKNPTDTVRHLCAVQSQDFNGAVWAVSQRSSDEKAADFLTAFNRGDILRTHVMRPTWHFVTADDIVWMLDLTRDRLMGTFGYYFKKYDLNDALFRKTNAILAAELVGDRHATRKELGEVLAQQDIDVRDSIRLAHIFFYAELSGLICSGAVRGKEQTYALLSERAPRAITLDRSDALVELARRYFISHGPATLDDFVWWSGLTKRDAAFGLDGIKKDLQQTTIDNTTYWGPPSSNGDHDASKAFFLPNYDEYIVAYTNRDGLFDLATKDRLDSRQNPLFNNVLIMDGIAVGTWKKTIKNNTLTLSITAFRAFTTDETKQIHMAAMRYRDHLGCENIAVDLV